MTEFPNVSLVVMHSNMNINTDSNKRVHKQTNNKQTNKQTNMYGHLRRWLKPLISQNVHHINHNKDHKQMKWQGLDLHGFSQMKWQGLDLHGISCLLSQGSLISSIVIDFNDMIKAQYRVDVPSACTTAWHRILTLLIWWADQPRTKDITPHRRTCSLLTLHYHWHDWCSFCNFSIETLSHILKYCPFPDGIIITSRVSF